MLHLSLCFDFACDVVEFRECLELCVCNELWRVVGDGGSTGELAYHSYHLRHRHFAVVLVHDVMWQPSVRGLRAAEPDCGGRGWDHGKIDRCSGPVSRTCHYDHACMARTDSNEDTSIDAR